jgi:CPA1 family monovalent cation:H+ antiporter
LEVFEAVIALLMGGAALSALASRIGAPYPALVALAGAGLALVPVLPTLELDPELALTLFIAPVLLDAAFDSSPRDLRANWKPVVSLALGAVVLTVALVALVVKWFVPDLPWAAATALGAIVAPPDAAAATAVLRQLRPPYRILVILEGESLFNDASALLIFRLAVAATLGAAVSGWSVLSTMFVVTLGSLILGWVLSKLVIAISKRIQDVAIAVVVQFGSTFAVWMLAERLHLSGIITLVVFAISASRDAPSYLEAKMRIPAWAVWDVAVFVLNVLAFVLIGFQLKSIVSRTSSVVGVQYLITATAVCGTVIVARMIWVFLAYKYRRRHWHLFQHQTGSTNDIRGVTPASASVVAWSGMRGTVTLAAALALPLGFPHRDLIVASAFGVTLGTLVLQGLTLRPLISWLDLKDEGLVEHEVRIARVESLKAALKVLAESPPTPTGLHIKQGFQLQLRRAQQEIRNLSMKRPADSDRAKSFAEEETSLLEEALQAQRNELVLLRTSGIIGDAAFQKVQEELDWMELGWMYSLGHGPTP